MTLKDGGPAFPVLGYERGAEGNIHTTPTIYEGMTLRDWFAGQALAGQISFEGMEGCDADQIAAMAYELAAAMLRRRDAPERT